MKPLLTALMLGHAALFVFGALRHAGGAAAVLKQSLKAWRAAFIGNLVAIIGVAIGVVARAVGAGPGPQATTCTTGSCWRWRPPPSLILVVPAGRMALRRN
jgi:hypothetical protein